jgi:hypothetical protein
MYKLKIQAMKFQRDPANANKTKSDIKLERGRNAHY